MEDIRLPESYSHLFAAQDLLQKGLFEEALQENRMVLSLSPESPPSDAALFTMGLIHVHHANPKKDYRKARSFFTRFQKEFPDNPRVEEARTWISLLDTILERTAQPDRRPPYVQRVQNLIRRGDFEGALKENRRILSASPKSPPGDAALFSMGLIHIHYANPTRDYGKALSFFRQLQTEFSGSPFTEEAKVWIGVLQAMEKARQIEIEIEEKKKELAR